MGYKLTPSLSPAQLEHRRHLLNQAGFIAWLSPIILLTAIYITRRTLSYLSAQPPSRTSKSKPKAKPSTSSPFTLALRKTTWFLSHATPPTPEFGPWSVPLAGALYTTWLLYLAARNTGDDYMHLTKALGHVGVATLPFHYLLAIKSPNSPVALATGLTHESLNTYHRLLGRVVHALLAGHAVLYLNFFVQLGVLEGRLKAPVVRLGIAAFWTVNFLGILALPVVRRKAYHALFYRSHVVLSALLLVIVWFHVPYTRWYVAQAATFWLANGLVRSRDSTAVCTAEVQKLEGTELIRLRVRIPGNSPLLDFIPGQHVYVKRATGMFGPKTPFTIVSVSPDGKDSAGNPAAVLDLLIRNLHGPQTGWLAANKSVAVALEGPYGEASEYIPALLRDGTDTGPILLVAGGVGATYTLPIYAALVTSRKSSAGLSLVWVVRTLDEARWGVELLASARAASADPLDVVVHFTRSSKDGEGKRLSSSGKVIADKLGETNKLQTRAGRPSMAEVLAGFFSEQTGKSLKGGKSSKKDQQPVTVLACGPPGMTAALRAELGRHVYGEGREVRLHEEQFGLGAA